MSLLYRAIWQDDRSDLVEGARTEFLRWLDRKRIGLDELPRSEEVPTPTGTVWITSREAQSGGTEALQVRLVEERDRETWTTILTALKSRAGNEGWYWIDVSRTSDDPFERPPFRAPVLTRLLVETGTDCRVGHVRLSTTPIAMAAGPLNGLIRNERRRLPLVVFAHDFMGDPGITSERAQAALDRLAGVAQIFIVPGEQLTAFNELMGEELGIHSGAARVYLPNSGPAGLRSERHRFVPRSRVERSLGAAGDDIVQLLTPSVTATPPPPLYKSIERALVVASSGTDTRQLLELALNENHTYQSEIEQLRAEKAILEEENLDLLAETEELQESFNHMAAALQSTARAKSHDRSPATELSATVDSIGEAIADASRLSGLAVHPDAAREIDKLDSSIESSKWANAIWRGLRALDAYASEGANGAGGFWEWCQRGAAAWTWPASPKKLAMRESETVMANERLRKARVLPCAKDLDPSGTIVMEAHLKISEGGGILAPRIYFHDDTAGGTGKIHVGFIGPHEHMPNTRTN